MENNVLVYIDDDGVCAIKLVGQVRYGTTSVGFDEFVNTNVADEKVKEVIVDLRECDFIDSTNMGTLAKIAYWQNKKHYKKPILLYNEDSKIAAAINDIHVRDLYEVSSDTEIVTDGYKNIENVETTQIEITKMMYEGHKLLCSLHKDNESKFKDVMIYLKNSINSMEQRRTTSIPRIITNYQVKNC